MFDIHAFIEANLHPSIATDSGGRILSLNKSSAELLDLEEVDWKGKNITAFLPVTGELLNTGEENFQAVQEITTRKQVPVYLAIRAVPMTSNDKRFYWFLLERREAHQLELEKIRERYQLAVEAGHTGIWDYSFETGQLIIDESLKNLLGYKNDEIIDEEFFWNKLVAEEDRKELKQAIETNIRQGKTYFEETFRMVHRHRVLLWVLGRGKIVYRKKDPYRIICSVTDITDRREASEQLRKTLINFKAIFDAFPDLFFRVDRIGDFLEIMAGESSDFGIPGITGFEGKNLRDAFPDTEYLKLYDCLQQAFESRKVEKCEYVLKVNGRKRYYEARMIAITHEEAIGIVRDITDAVKVNRELFRAKRTAEEALNARDSFFSMISHEMRTPLNVVIGMIFLLLEKEPRTDQLKFIHTMQFSADNLLSLINDLLDFSKIRAGKIVFERTDFNLIELIGNIYNSYKLQLDNAALVNVVLDIDEDLPAILYGDSKRLSQILNNLLGNAQKFTEKGEIGISVRRSRAAGDMVWVEFRISDTGIGIPEKKTGDIFKPFDQGAPDTSRKFGGTGLGLAIVKQLVELQQGTINVQSRQGEGSVFTVTLPFAVQKEIGGTETEKNKIHEGISRLESMQVLYADDVSSNLFLMKGYADLWKFSLDTAGSGEQALTLFREKTYDLILLDLQMPGKNGFEIASEIRSIEGEIGVYTPIIAVTGDISDATLRQIYASGMDDYLSKPVNPRTMLEKIGRWYRHDKDTRIPGEAQSEEKGNSGESMVEFQQVDYLYEDAPEQYAQYIRQLSQEFRANLELLSIALREENFDEFRRIRHGMKSSLKLLSMNSLQALLDEIREKFKQSQLPPGGGDYDRRAGKMIGRILEILEEKLEVLTG